LSSQQPSTATSSLLGPLPSLGNSSGFKSGSQLPSISSDNKQPAAQAIAAMNKRLQQEEEEEEEEEEGEDYEE
jgi:hypothetical protein